MDRHHFDINADVIVVKGAGHLRVRPRDTGIILATTERDALVLIDRTERRAWLPHQDLRCTRLGGWKAMYDSERLVCPVCLEVNHLRRREPHYDPPYQKVSDEGHSKCGWCRNPLRIAEAARATSREVSDG